MLYVGHRHRSCWSENPEVLSSFYFPLLSTRREEKTLFLRIVIACLLLISFYCGYILIPFCYLDIQGSVNHIYPPVLSNSFSSLSNNSIPSNLPLPFFLFSPVSDSHCSTLNSWEIGCLYFLYQWDHKCLSFCPNLLQSTSCLPVSLMPQWQNAVVFLWLCNIKLHTRFTCW